MVVFLFFQAPKLVQPCGFLVVEVFMVLHPIQS